MFNQDLRLSLDHGLVEEQGLPGILNLGYRAFQIKGLRQDNLEYLQWMLTDQTFVSFLEWK